MNNRIEFMGLPGSGKTTLYNMILNEAQSSNLVLGDYHHLFKQGLKNKYKRGSKKRYAEFLLANICLRGGYMPLVEYNEQITDFIINNHSTWKEFTNLIFMSEDTSRLNFLLRDNLIGIARWGIIEDYVDEKFDFILMDEGFSHRIVDMSIPTYNKNIEMNIENIFLAIGFPSIVVNITCDVEECISRMKKRYEGVPESYRMWSENEVKMKFLKKKEFIEYLIPILESFGCKVITVKNDNLETAKNKIIYNIKLLYKS